MYGITLFINDCTEKDKLSGWISEEFPTRFRIISRLDHTNEPQIIVIEITKLLDWLNLSRIKKRYNNLLIFPLIQSDMLHTVPLAMTLNLQFLLIKPLKKSLFIRSFKRALLDIGDVNDYHLLKVKPPLPKEECNQPLQEVFLRRLLRGDVTSEQEIIDSRLFQGQNSMPNTVYFIQGFVKDATLEEHQGWQAPQIIQQLFIERLSEIVGQVCFLPYRKHLLMLLRLPSTVVSPRYWKEGEEIILQIIHELQESYGIYLYIGVGSINSEPLMLQHSYLEARNARRTPPYKRVILRYSEETSTEPQILKSIDYIARHYAEEISITKVSAHINFSSTYFSRLFKKETGRSFVEYVTFVRLQRAVYLLRHSNHTIEKIADELGFNTPNYFSNIFKKYTDFCPSDYRATKEIIFY